MDKKIVQMILRRCFHRIAIAFTEKVIYLQILSLTMELVSNIKSVSYEYTARITGNISVFDWLTFFFYYSPIQVEERFSIAFFNRSLVVSRVKA